MVRTQEIPTDQMRWLMGVTLELSDAQMESLKVRLNNPDLWEWKTGWRGFQDNQTGIAVIYDYAKDSWRIILKDAT